MTVTFLLIFYMFYEAMGGTPLQVFHIHPVAGGRVSAPSATPSVSLHSATVFGRGKGRVTACRPHPADARGPRAAASAIRACADMRGARVVTRRERERRPRDSQPDGRRRLAGPPPRGTP
jgi:hypothetical protein